MSVSKPSAVHSSGEKPMKVLIAGDPRCGKTTMLTALKRGADQSEETNSPYLYVRLMASEDPICLCLEEAPSSPESGSIRSSMYKEAKAIVLCFSPTQSDALTRIEEFWFQEIRKTNTVVPLFLVSLKWDVEGEMFLCPGEAEVMGRKIRAFTYVEFTPENPEEAKQKLLRRVANVIFAQNFNPMLRKLIQQ